MGGWFRECGCGKAPAKIGARVGEGRGTPRGIQIDVKTKELGK